MKYFELNGDEQQLLKDYEAGKLQAVERESARKQYAAYAKGVLDKTRNVNIRISEQDLLKIKALAVQKGIPYQTMITSVIHQYSTGQLKDTVS